MAGVARRSVLRGAAVAALLPITAVGAATAATRTRSSTAGERAALENFVGRAVTITGAAGSETATLTAVRDLRHAPAGHPHAFASTFRLAAESGSEVQSGPVDITAPGLALRGVGLVLTDPERRTAVLHIDRRSVSEHLANQRSSS